MHSTPRKALIHLAIVGAIASTLTACGGGGPGGADLIAGGSGGGSGGGGATPTPIPAVAKIVLTPTQASLALGETIQVTALVVDANNSPIAGAVVNFTTDTTLGLLSPNAGLTNSAGQMTTTLSVANISASGKVGELIASAKYKDASGTDQTITNSMAYQIGSSTLKIDSMQAGLASISANANTSVEVQVSANGKPISGQTVNFSSQCAQAGKATIDATALTNASGKAIASFTDKGCANTDTITATLSNGQSQNVQVTIAPPTAASLSFNAITPTDGVITLKGYASATRPDTAQVQFKVVDATGAPIPGQAVTFSLNTAVGGVTLLNAVSGKVTVTTDNNGVANATVISGNQPASILVTAASGALSSTSRKLAISSGFPDQDSTSLAADKYNINGWNYDGTEAKITMRFADHFNNPVPDGTAINFITDGGRIGTGTQGSCTTVDSSCQITLTSQNPRPSNGRVHVLAYALGEESFVDKNNNIIADQNSELVDINGNVGGGGGGEPIDKTCTTKAGSGCIGVGSDIGEAFNDTNENGFYDQGVDHLIDFNSDGKYNGPDGLYSGTLCATGFAKCSTNRTLNIFQQATFIFSSDDPKTPLITPALPTSLVGTCGTLRDFTAYIPDIKGNILPAGTKISVASTNGTGSVVTGASQTIGSATPLVGAQVLNQTLFQFQFQFGAAATPCPAASTGVLTITVDTPAGGGQAAKKTSFNYNYNIN
ncbi:Ig-like domain-containing protein [Deefgea piscis]|uniref:Ig-like domain-containing protein n=1 Tax=Deefgea piscis TaxID=2739061 RepID=A0A6M8SPE7_9NEIS|nr:Ig-like domain-containing protein [Deefgea piscis]QKJ66581.1 Ig-like domain-containing protein [Deefgea piscis]